MAEPSALEGFRKQVRHAREIFQQEGLGIAASRVLGAAGGVLRCAASIARMKLKQPDATAEELVDLAFRSKELSPIQIRFELVQLLEIVQRQKPKALMEIGTMLGGTLLLFCRVADPDALILSIDLPPARFGYPDWRVPLYRAFAKQNQKIHLIRADSHAEETPERARGILGGRELDFLFIDGDHAYQGVKRDFEMYAPLVKRGGTVAFHDIAAHPPSAGCEVRRLWEEIKTSYPHREIFQDPNQQWAGIGLLTK